MYIYPTRLAEQSTASPNNIIIHFTLTSHLSTPSLTPCSVAEGVRRVWAEGVGRRSDEDADDGR